MDDNKTYVSKDDTSRPMLDKHCEPIKINPAAVDMLQALQEQRQVSDIPQEWLPALNRLADFFKEKGIPPCYFTETLTEYVDKTINSIDKAIEESYKWQQQMFDEARERMNEQFKERASSPNGMFLDTWPRPNNYFEDPKRGIKGFLKKDPPSGFKE